MPVRYALNSFLYFPERELFETPRERGLEFEDLTIETDDGERLHGWWIPAHESQASVLLCHGNGGNIGDRVLNAALLTAQGLGVLLFDYRGYGRSTGRPDEQGTYRDAHSAREVLMDRAAGEPIVYIGESLGGAVALELALAHPPDGLVLQSAFTSVRDMAREHYAFIPGPLVPDAYPSLELIGGLDAPLLVIHGESDEIVPASHGKTLYEAAPEPKRLELLARVGHNDLVPLAGSAYAEAVGSWVRQLKTSSM